MLPAALETLSAYQYDLPGALIARYPAEPRDSSRLLVIDRARGRWEHRTFRDLPECLRSGDTLVANNSRVIRARLLGQRLLPDGSLGGKVEVVLLEALADGSWEALFKASARYVKELRFRIPTPDGAGLTGELIRGSAESPQGTVVARFDRDPVASGAGELPLPHYLERPCESSDEKSYQTLYARHPGSAAAPTAGLHFTDRVLEDLRTRGIGWRELTLHVGLGTFRPVKAENIREHSMHEERFEIEPEIAGALNRCGAEGRRIVAVGTTSVRTLESAWREGPGLRAGAGRTSLFIRPGAFEFRVVRGLLTNFHLPGSTLLMLVCAFGGRDLILSAYEEAVRENYRFFSYGDAMLVL